MCQPVGDFFPVGVAPVLTIIAGVNCLVGSGCCGPTFLNHFIRPDIEPANECARVRTVKFSLIPLLALRVDGLRYDTRVENPVCERKPKKSGDRFVAVGDGVVAKVKSVGWPPKAAPAWMLDQGQPFFERPVVDGVEELVERER